MKRIFKYVRNTFLTLIAALLLWAAYVELKEPTNHANWQQQYTVLPRVEIDGDLLLVNYVRDFRYNADESIAEQTYQHESYKLSALENVWYGISHFGENGLAHVLLSFEFRNEKFLVVSIEARLTEDDTEGYDPIKGLFANYTKTIVLATEQDVIGLRTHVRGEPFYLYQLDLPELNAKALLLNFLRKAEALNSEPTFYNSIINNCMTGLLKESDRFKNKRSWIDRRIFLPGYSDELAYEMGIIDTSLPFSEVRKRALVDPSSTALEDEDFSANIRKKTD